MAPCGHAAQALAREEKRLRLQRERGVTPEPSLDLEAILADRSVEVLEARDAVAQEARTPKGVSKLLDELHAELAA